MKPMFQKPRRKHFAEKIGCPVCENENTKVVCGHIQGTEKIRRRKCLQCGHNIKTIQTIEPEIGREVIAPFLTQAEKRARRRASPRHTKLTVIDVQQIKYFLSKKSFTTRDLAAQYGVKKGCISSIIRGQSWKDISTPSELP
tara:strand:- start:111 stop:536 length:426 start_codon:yes stop_codon:yes gene_type:complete